mmetsp:Transcript_26606/g.32281  ORF Transcript_26606/g.32281 Transcript_26606/m.32281 type:complete len:353 (+) Transcript_26606:210-1268(+)|eukprot:CAMPEP_0197860086 /NCGR_PEP_ID=MMETSP1438-20131217/35225_1 /TAXON_ID=1461541 /ORGANISM="Pterosperma sp., Strain CCMP1384" /LENGTH=352 /DNA_ID=CAMNT_0043476837 /DNA_START=204 /DNA_END=1262 /DNA_ORIENTATION=+
MAGKDRAMLQLHPLALLLITLCLLNLTAATRDIFGEYARSAESVHTLGVDTNSTNSLRKLTTVTKSKKSIVVVGNGMSLIGSGLGPAIDKFDEVARFNFYQTQGYEGDVGTKTSIWVLAQIKDPKDTPNDGRKETVKKIIVPFSYRGGCKRVDQPCKITSKESKKMIEHKTKLLMEKYEEANLQDKTLISTLDEIDQLYTDYNLYEKFPSSGLQMLTFFSTYFEEVAYAGFDFSEGSHDHYFERKMKNETCHNMKDEARIISLMVKQGRLKPLGAPPNVPPGLDLTESIKEGYDPDCKILCDYKLMTCKKISANGKKPTKSKKGKGKGAKGKHTKDDKDAAEDSSENNSDAQ